MRTRFFGDFAQRINGAKSDIVDFLLGGGAKSYEEYRERVGYLDGLNKALELADELDREALGLPANAPRTTAPYD